MPVSSVEVEHSFSKTRQILSPQGHGKPDDTYRAQNGCIMYFNGNLDIGK